MEAADDDSDENLKSDFLIGDRIKLTYNCRFCKNTCYLTQKHIKWFKERKLSLPVYCNKLCRDKNDLLREERLMKKSKE